MIDSAWFPLVILYLIVVIFGFVKHKNRNLLSISIAWVIEPVVASVSFPGNRIRLALLPD
ncbi:MAG: hypothetical protein IJ757_07785 [Clostridiales bacterium]|nr:hypothetical protein [Clostridiales bacterium]